MRIIFINIFLVFAAGLLFSQDIILEKDVTEAYKNIRGANTKTYTQFFMGTGTIIDQEAEDGTNINMLRSGYLLAGLRQKFKILSFYAIGYELSYGSLRYNIKQETNKTFPTGVMHDNEKLRFNSLGISLYNRINIGKRGNIIGKFIDAGVYAGWIFRSVHITKDRIDDPVNLSKVTVAKFSSLGYAERIHYGVNGRIGINWIALRATYRLSDMFKSSYDLPELPRLQIGLEVTLPN